MIAAERDGHPTVAHCGCNCLGNQFVIIGAPVKRQVLGDIELYFFPYFKTVFAGGVPMSDSSMRRMCAGPRAGPRRKLLLRSVGAPINRTCRIN